MDAERAGPRMPLGPGPVPVITTADRLRSTSGRELTSVSPEYSESIELLVGSPASISLAERRTDAMGKLEKAAGRPGLRTLIPDDATV